MTFKTLFSYSSTVPLVYHHLHPYPYANNIPIMSQLSHKHHLTVLKPSESLTTPLIPTDYNTFFSHLSTPNVIQRTNFRAPLTPELTPLTQLLSSLPTEYTTFFKCLNALVHPPSVGRAPVTPTTVLRPLESPFHIANHALVLQITLDEGM